MQGNSAETTANLGAGPSLTLTPAAASQSHPAHPQTGGKLRHGRASLQKILLPQALARAVRHPDRVLFHRQLQNPVMQHFRRTSFPGTGRVQEASSSLSRGTLKNFPGKVQDFAVQRATQAGAIGGAAAGQTGTPALKDGLTRFSAY